MLNFRSASDGVEVTFTGDAEDALRSKKLRPMRYPPLWGDTNVQAHHDPHNEYVLNNYLHRGPDFKSDIDLLCAGCSLTYGIGVPEAGTWPHQVSKDTGLSYVNLSAPGASVEWIVNSIFSYIHTFGKPNVAVLALLPDSIRGEIAINSKTTRSSELGPRDLMQSNWDEKEEICIFTHQSLNFAPEPKLVKQPFPVEYVTSKEEAFRKSIQSIKNLELYCEAADIKLFWGSWSDDFNYIGEHNPDIFDNYIDIHGIRDWVSYSREIPETSEDPEGIFDYKINHDESDLDKYGCKLEWGGTDSCVCFVKCHEDLLEEHPLSFHLGTDRFKDTNTKYNAHMGVHKLRHLADDFVSALREGS